MDLAEKLLVLAAAAGTDGGQELVRVLRGVLAEIAPFDAGEAVLEAEGRILRWRLDDHPGELLGPDLLRHVTALRAPLRLDDLPDASAFPETHARLEALALRALLVLPFPEGEGRGALAVARRHGWAFVGTSLHLAEPVAGMAGIALRQAVVLTGRGQRLDELTAELDRATATPNELRARLERAEAEARAREAQRAAASAGWESTRSELRETVRVLAAAEETARAARAAREQAAARATELEERIAAETAARDTAEAESRRRQGEGDERLGRVEGERQALAVEVEALRRERMDARGREEGSAQQRSSLRAALAEQEAQVSDLRSRLADLEAILAASRRERDAAQREADRSRSAAEDAGRAEANTLRAELQAAQVEAEELRARLAEIPVLVAERQTLRGELEAARDEATRARRAAERAEARRSRSERPPLRRRRAAQRTR